MDTKKLRQKILDLAIHGKLVPQDPNDEPASVLLERIRAEKEALIKEGKIKRAKKTTTSDTSHYENVPFEVPDGWSWCTVGDIVYDLKYGTSNKSSDSGSVPVLRMGNLTRKGTISYDNLVYSSDLSDIEEYELISGDLLFNRTNSSDWVGKTALYDGKIRSIYAGYLIRVRTIIINSEYLNIVMNSQYYRNWCYSVKTDAVNQSNINANKLASLLVPIPPISEQNRIVQEVTKMVEFVELVEQGGSDLLSIIGNVKSKILDLAIHGKLVPQDANDEPASELLKRINSKAVASCDNPHYEQVPFEIPSNWTWATLGYITNYGKCSTVPVDDIDEGSWILELEDIEKDSAKVIKLWTKSDRDIKGVRHSFSKGYVLYSKLRTYLNKVLVANKDGFCTTEIIPIKCSDSIYPEYLCHVLRSKYFLDYTAQCGYGVKMPRLSTTDARNALVPLPPYEEQIKISAKIKELYCSLDYIAETSA